MTKDFDINTATVQEAMDYAVKKMVEQGGRCVGRFGGTTCSYGDGNGNHCGVGWLLDKGDKELMNFEGGLLDLIFGHRDKIPALIKDNADIFYLLQGLHDTSLGEVARGKLRALGKKGIDTSGKHWQDWVKLVEKGAVA